MSRRRREPEPDEGPLDPSLPVLLLTMNQVASMCQISVARVREWTLMPGFPVIRTPHMVRIHVRLLDEWLADQAQQSRQEDAA